jgi:hypothetical protein
MAKTANEYRAVVDAFAHLSADITAAPSDADAQRLRSFTASAARSFAPGPAPGGDALDPGGARTASSETNQ